MTPDQIAELQNLSVAEISEQVSTLDANDLAALRRLETDGGQKEGRKGVIAAIDAAEKALATPAAGDDAPPPAPAPSPAPRRTAATAAAGPAPKAAAWQAPDYAGPLTIDQASWRRANLKPVRGAHTK